MLIENVDCDDDDDDDDDDDNVDLKFTVIKPNSIYHSSEEVLLNFHLCYNHNDK